MPIQLGSTNAASTGNYSKRPVQAERSLHSKPKTKQTVLEDTTRQSAPATALPTRKEGRGYTSFCEDTQLEGCSDFNNLAKVQRNIKTPLVADKGGSYTMDPACGKPVQKSNLLLRKPRGFLTFSKRKLGF